MSFNDKLKQAIDEIDLDRRVAELKGAAGELAREHGARLEEALGKVEATVDERTKGKYADDQLASARRKVTDTVATVAELPPAPAPETHAGGGRPAGLPPPTAGESAGPRTAPYRRSTSRPDRSASARRSGSAP